MITRKNLLSGSFGKLQNIGGSRCLPTPQTLRIQPDYSINISYNIQGDLVAHSLDGRLWLYRRSRRLGIIALKWNASTAKLEFAAAQNLSNNSDVILACGLDWVLTNNNIFMVSDNEPYIISANLFDTNIEDTFLYSLLRTSGAGDSGIDPFTSEAWGKREDNGNSEGSGYFSKDAHLLYPAGTHTFEQCYSLLPAVGDWQIFENFLIRRPDHFLNDSYNFMQNVRPLIPLEFHNGKAVYGTGYNFSHRGIQLAHFDGKIYGRGLYNIGRVFLLPAVFDENGEVQEYYLYISPDYPCSPFIDEALDSTDDWLNMGLFLADEDSLYGFLNASSGSITLKAAEAKLFDPDSKDWLNLSENHGAVFVDGIHSSGLLLNDSGATFLTGDFVNNPHKMECSLMSQWLAPNGNIQAVTENIIAAPVNDSCVYTFPNAELVRFMPADNTLPLTAAGFEDSDGKSYSLAISEGTNSNNRKTFAVNQFSNQKQSLQTITWQNIFKQAISIEVMNHWEIPFFEVFYDYSKCLQYIHILNYKDENDYVDYRMCNICGYMCLPLFLTERHYNDIIWSGVDRDGYSFAYRYHSSVDANILFVDFSSNSLEHIDIHCDISFLNPNTYNMYFRYVGRIVFTTENQIGFLRHYSDSGGVDEGAGDPPLLLPSGYSDKIEFVPLADIPDTLKGCVNLENIEIFDQFKAQTPFKNFLAPGCRAISTYDNTDLLSVIFTEYTAAFTSVIATSYPRHRVKYIFNYPCAGEYFLDSSNVKRSLKNFHLVFTQEKTNSDYTLFLFKSELNPDIFDFYSEAERSKIS